MTTAVSAVTTCTTSDNIASRPFTVHVYGRSVTIYCGKRSGQDAFSDRDNKKTRTGIVEVAEKIDATSTYLNCYDRTIEVYIETFTSVCKYDLKTFICAQRKEISVLDCGAGKGKALNDLLTKYATMVKKCIGISMHYFKEVDKYIEKHDGALEWHVEKAEVILPTLNEKINLITDLFGAYFYSCDRGTLLTQYYRLLADGGRAYIYLAGQLQNSVIGLNAQEENLEESLVKKHSDIFAWGDQKKHFLIMTKKVSFVFSIALKPVKIEEYCWNWKKSAHFTEERKRAGQEYFPKIVIYELIEPQPSTISQ